MSPIGKAFLVLNLLLAGAFVGFAGTYLQKATDWKKQHDALKTTSETASREAGLRYDALRNDYEDEKRRHLQADTQKTRLESENKDLQAEIDRQEQRLATMTGKLSELESSYSAVSASIDRATKDAAQARSDIMAAQQTRDEAVRARETAEADLRDASDKIAQLTATVGSKDTQIAALEADQREKEILLSVVRSKAPGLLAMAQPSLGGTVQHVGANGKLVTITVTENPENAEIKPGYSFAIFKGNAYKGEALVTDVDGNHAFCRVQGDATAIQIGDSAKTNTY